MAARVGEVGMKEWVGRNWFLLALAGAAGLAFLVPNVGARGGPLRPEVTTKAGVALIFLIQGLVIAPAAVRAGAFRWRLHVVLQLFVFVGFPLAAILLDAAGGGLLPPDLRIGFLFLATLPTTISTCVLFTAAAGGNTTGALFNSALANTLGVFVTPMWAALLLSARGEAPPMGPMIAEVAMLLLLPLAIGQLVRPLVLRRWEPNARRLGYISSGVIVYIVFTAFANSVASGAFAETGVAVTFAVGAVAMGIFAAATLSARVLGHLLAFDPGDRLALLFCGPQKTLAAGAPMGQILFAGHPGIGLILLPILVYHAIQLLAGATLAQHLSSRAGTRGG